MLRQEGAPVGALFNEQGRDRPGFAGQRWAPALAAGAMAAGIAALCGLSAYGIHLALKQVLHLLARAGWELSAVIAQARIDAETGANLGLLFMGSVLMWALAMAYQAARKQA